ncbi:hypothetical protein MN116_001883 [Schistosoma mekongi]|uniref:Fucosyltransferase n=1 Tax=Schistosoma mekongi TaxID=38744 RepID=A0AAE2D977_SCHME|nr:hypothetical protein MN116_001883 [Schistosoma mekongi]
METSKDYTGFNPTIRFRIIIFLAVSTVSFGIFYIRDVNLNEIRQYISNYRNFVILSMTGHSKLYSNFTDFRNHFISGHILLNKNKKYEIIIYGHMLVTLNRDLTNCPVNNCIIHSDARRWISGDLILITDRLFPPGKRPVSQAWVAHEYESAFHTRFSNEINDKINFTAIYRFDSTIRTPYGMYTPFERRTNNSDRTLAPRRLENMANGKNRSVAWIVSNCNPRSPRKAYADELAKHITVDVYGRCGQMTCSGSDCFNMIRKYYKFYLSFENSLCQDYITEKFFFNALMNNAIPIVMGASIEEYQKVSPPHSFIHVDQFENPKELASYLKYLDKNDTAYNEYFTWHNEGVVTLWSFKPECEFCLLANALPYLKPTMHDNFIYWLKDGCKNRKLRWTN